MRVAKLSKEVMAIQVLAITAHSDKTHRQNGENLVSSRRNLEKAKPCASRRRKALGL